MFGYVWEGDEMAMSNIPPCHEDSNDWELQMTVLLHIFNAECSTLHLLSIPPSTKRSGRLVNGALHLTVTSVHVGFTCCLTWLRKCGYKSCAGHLDGESDSMSILDTEIQVQLQSHLKSRPSQVEDLTCRHDHTCNSYILTSDQTITVQCEL